VDDVSRSIVVALPFVLIFLGSIVGAMDSNELRWAPLYSAFMLTSVRPEVGLALFFPVAAFGIVSQLSTGLIKLTPGTLFGLTVLIGLLKELTIWFWIAAAMLLFCLLMFTREHVRQTKSNLANFLLQAVPAVACSILVLKLTPSSLQDSAWPVALAVFFG